MNSRMQQALFRPGFYMALRPDEKSAEESLKYTLKWMSLQQCAIIPQKLTNAAKF